MDKSIFLKVIFADDMTSQSIDNFCDIIGGVGISNLVKNKKSDYPLRNCILFGCKAMKMQQFMKKSYLVAMYNPQVWKHNKTECMSTIYYL